MFPYQAGSGNRPVPGTTPLFCIKEVTVAAMALDIIQGRLIVS